MNIILFGQLTDITGSESICLTGIADTDSLVNELNKKYPAIKDAKYVIAVDKMIITANTIITDTSTIALLPPFSGG